jgi:hypothetical protein
MPDIGDFGRSQARADRSGHSTCDAILQSTGVFVLSVERAGPEVTATRDLDQPHRQPKPGTVAPQAADQVIARGVGGRDGDGPRAGERRREFLDNPACYRLGADRSLQRENRNGRPIEGWRPDSRCRAGGPEGERSPARQRG